MFFDNLNKGEEMLKDKLTALLEELEGIDNRVKGKDEVIEKVQEENKYLQKLVDEGFKTFNTDTHCLIEREKLYDIINTLEEISTYDVEDIIGNARSYCEDAEYSLSDISTYRDDAMKSIEKILNDTEVIEEVDDETGEVKVKVTAKKSPAKKQ